MSEPFELVEKTFGPVIEIEERVGMLSMPATFGRDFKRIMAHLQAHGAECTELPYARYQEMDWERELNQGMLATLSSMLFKRWHFFVGMPTSRLLPGDGPMVSRELPSRRYARALHRGPYRQCGATYKALHAWAREQGLVLANEAIECYVNDPREVGQDGLETVILIPLESE